ncbi:GDP-mannose 4,6-dehydratase [Sphingobium fuliginis]|jgi:nucleoside-diphosphate-sugar epimerase|uniref:GDP-mannose 4,6-dehydratase n=1 Tax=Sphingobium fuliginis (strain ATCC 27551) TaxID=336203 RepID=A0A7M2GDF0_SPHSA|nr:NAD-dependent epimerase/dehydratase family protein [Sphingobium fuliginis]QOT70720.1 GDP-mannose 4,6-dehydratase [Sphingobium fuliginis]
MRVALTGATGFTGRFVTSALEKAGLTPVALRVDLRNKDAVDKVVNATDFDRVIHLAGHAFVEAADWQSFYSINQLGTLNLLDAVARKRPGARCIIASSAQVYGPHAEGLILEDAPTNPTNHYALSKWAMERGAELWRDRLEIVATRPFNYTGVGQDTKYLIPKIVDHFRRRADVIELGNTWVRRDFGDVRTVADAYTGLVQAAVVPSVVNISTGSVFSIGDILERLTVLSGHHIDVQVNPAFVRKGDVEVLGGSAATLRQILPDWQPMSLDDTLEWMYSVDDSQRRQP